MAYVADALEGLNYLHKQGIVHCDIKLDNLLCHKEEGEQLATVLLYPCHNNVA
jgi:calcium/calmodulin-dependent protein kinase I